MKRASTIPTRVQDGDQMVAVRRVVEYVTVNGRTFANVVLANGKARTVKLKAVR